jgi:hypothetical protein
LGLQGSSQQHVQFVQDDQAVLLQTIPKPAQAVGDVDDLRVNIKRTGNTLTANIKQLNIRITATWHAYNSIFRFINYQVYVPRFLCERSIGHLGNCDDNPDNDVSGPDDCEL